MADVYLCTDWKGLGEYGCIAAIEASYYLKKRTGAGDQEDRFTPVDEVPIFEVPALRRYREEQFEDIFGQMVELCNHERLVTKEVELVIGVNEFGGIVDSVLDGREEASYPTRVNITATGTTSRYVDDTFHIPRHELVTILTMSYYSDRIKVASDLPLLPQLDEQLLSLRRRTDTGQMIRRDSVESGEDDIVRSVAIGVWLARQEHQVDRDHWKRLEGEFGDKDEDADEQEDWNPYSYGSRRE